MISSHCSDESLRNYIDHPSSEQLRACSDILSNALNVRPHLSQQESFMGLSSQAILTFLWIPLLFFHKTHALSSLFSNCQVKKLVFFLSATIWPDFTEFFTSHSVLETKKLQATVLNSTCWTISVCKLLQIVNFDGVTFLTALFFILITCLLDLTSRGAMTVLCHVVKHAGSN